MLSLVLKDIIVQKKSIVFCILYTIFIIFASGGIGTFAFTSGVSAISYMLLLISCAYEDKNKCDVMLNSLPISRQQVVLTKYITVYLYIGICAIVYFLITSIFFAVNVPLDISPLTVESLLGGIVAVAFLSSAYLPLYFKLGYIKSKFMLIPVFGILGLTGVIGNSVVKEMGMEWVKAIGSVLSRQSDVMIGIGLLLIVFIIQFISYSIAVGFYKTREF